MTKKTVKVYSDKGQVVGAIAQTATSIGASKMTGVAMQLARINGEYAWTPSKK